MPAITPSFLLPFLLASATQADRPAGQPSSQWAQLTIEQRVIIRIPTVRSRTATAGLAEEAAPPPMRLREVRAPRCLPLGRIRGAIITMSSGVTMLTNHREQFRAHFGRSCRTADFYAGFYIEPHRDGAICAGRDTLHARNGSTCEIEKFSQLVPDPEEAEPPEPPRPPRPPRPDR